MAKKPGVGNMFDNNYQHTPKYVPINIGLTNEELYEKFKKDLSNYVFKIVIVFVIIMFGYYLLYPTDTSDEGRFSRSGLALHIDAKTGCHYVASQYGGITPRLTAEGAHICTGEE